MKREANGEERPRFLRRTWNDVVWGAKVVAGVGVLGVLGVGAGSLYGFVNPPVAVRRVEVPVPVEAPTPQLDELLREVPQAYGISPLVAQAIAHRESNGRMGAKRYEPHLLERAKKVAPKGAMPEEVREYASSHCAMQVLGLHMPRLGLQWFDLYDPRTCVEVSMKILRECMDRHKGKSKVEQIHGALACYNGSTEYADAVMSRIGEALIEQYL